MTLPLAAEPTAVDPFGLWQAPTSAAGDALSFAAPGESAPESGPDTPAAVWTLALTSGPDGRPSAGQALERLAEQVQSIQTGLDAAGPRAEALLAPRLLAAAYRRTSPMQVAAPRSGVSFDPGEPSVVETLPPPEAGLAQALNALEPRPQRGWGKLWPAGDGRY